MSSASHIAVRQNPVTEVTGAWAMLVLKGRNHYRTTAGQPEL